MTDALLTQNDRAEALSRAYVSAVAAMAGYTISAPDFDRDSIDVVIGAGGKCGRLLGHNSRRPGAW